MSNKNKFDAGGIQDSLQRSYKTHPFYSRGRKMKWQFSGSTPIVATVIGIGLAFIVHRPVLSAPGELLFESSLIN